MNGPRSSFHPAWQARPYWWEEVPPTPTRDDLPDRTDVAIIGAGLAGLSAARNLARTGARVTVLDAHQPGFGAATRNHGMVGGGLKLPADIDRVLGKERADQIRQNARDSFLEFKQMVAKTSSM